MPFAKTNDGHEIYYEQHGTSGPLLVLVSGYFGITNNWQPLISKLKSDHQLIAFDNRGYGRSSKPESPAAYSIPRHAEDLGAVLKSANVNSKVILVTHSMGGNIASAFTLSNPDLVSGIISSGVYYDGKSLRDVGITADMLVSNAELPSRAVDFYVKMGLDPSFAIEAAHWPAYARRNNALALLEYEIGDGYAKIKVPALMVQGAEAYARRNNAPLMVCLLYTSDAADEMD